MKNKLLLLQAKLQAYKVLPQSEYRSIGEHLLPEVKSIIAETESFESSVRKEWENKYIDSIIKAADTNKYVSVVINDLVYTVHVTKENK